MGTWQVAVVVFTVMTWFNGPPSSFVDVARKEAMRRGAIGHATRQYSNDDLAGVVVTESVPSTPPPPAAAAAGSDDDPPPASPAAAPATPPATPAAPDQHDEQWWRSRVATAQGNLDRDQVLAQSLQSRINALTTDWTNRDDPGQKAQLFQDRQRAIDELDKMQKQVDADHKAIDDVMDDARRAGVPAGWLRGGTL